MTYFRLFQDIEKQPIDRADSFNTISDTKFEDSVSRFVLLRQLHLDLGNSNSISLQRLGSKQVEWGNSEAYLLE